MLPARGKRVGLLQWSRGFRPGGNAIPEHHLKMSISFNGAGAFAPEGTFVCCRNHDILLASMEPGLSPRREHALGMRLHVGLAASMEPGLSPRREPTISPCLPPCWACFNGAGAFAPEGTKQFPCLQGKAKASMEPGLSPRRERSGVPCVSPAMRFNGAGAFAPEGTGTPLWRGRLPAGASMEPGLSPRRELASLFASILCSRCFNGAGAFAPEGTCVACPVSGGGEAASMEPGLSPRREPFRFRASLAHLWLQWSRGFRPGGNPRSA